MSSPLFFGHLVGVPVETMDPGAGTKDTTRTKIFVGGLPYHSDDASLLKYFETFGDVVEAVVITDKHTGKSRGYGFVSTRFLSNYFILFYFLEPWAFISTLVTYFKSSKLFAVILPFILGSLASNPLMLAELRFTLHHA